MKNEDLIKILERARLPEAELHTHQRLLKTALLKNYESAPNKTATAVKRRRIPIMNTITGFFRSDRPVWQKTMVSTFAVIILLIAALAVNMSPLVRNYEAMAMEAALNDPEVQQIIEEEEIDTDTIKIVAAFDTENGIIQYISIDNRKMAVVELSKWIFTSKIVDVIEIETVPVTDASKQKLIEIASTNPEIKTLLDRGASIYMYYFHYIPAYMASSSFEDFVHETGGGSPLSIKDAEVISDYWVEFTAIFSMEYEGMQYSAWIDLLDESLISFRD